MFSYPSLPPQCNFWRRECIFMVLSVARGGGGGSDIIMFPTGRIWSSNFWSVQPETQTLSSCSVKCWTEPVFWTEGCCSLLMPTRSEESKTHMCLKPSKPRPKNKTKKPKMNRSLWAEGDQGQRGGCVSEDSSLFRQTVQKSLFFLSLVQSDLT